MSNFKDKEKYADIRVEPPLIIRVDGANFSNFCHKNFESPFSEKFHTIMINVAEGIINRFSFVKGAYHQSDEISFIIPDSVDYNGRIEKLNSLFAGKASSIFTKELLEKKDLDEGKCFDSRIVELDNINEVEDYIKYRKNNCFTNCVNALCYHNLKGKYSKKDLHGVGRDKRIKLLEEEGIDIDKVKDWKKYGTIIREELVKKKALNKKTGEEIMVDRHILKHKHPKYEKIPLF